MLNGEIWKTSSLILGKRQKCHSCSANGRTLVVQQSKMKKMKDMRNGKKEIKVFHLQTPLYMQNTEKNLQINLVLCSKFVKFTYFKVSISCISIDQQQLEDIKK